MFVLTVIFAIVAAWSVVAVGLALFIGRAVKIADRNEAKRHPLTS